MKYYFILRSNSAVNRIGEYGTAIYWTEKYPTKKAVKEAYTSKTVHGHTVKAVFTEEQFVEKYGADRAAKVKKCWL